MAWVGFPGCGGYCATILENRRTFQTKGEERFTEVPERALLQWASFYLLGALRRDSYLACDGEHTHGEYVSKYVFARLIII